MNNKGLGRKRHWPNLRYFSGILLEGLKNITSTLNQDDGPMSRESKPDFPNMNQGWGLLEGDIR